MKLAHLVGRYAWADGMPIKNGRFAGGEVTILTVTPEQVKTMRSSHELVLTRAQRQTLRDAQGEAAGASRTRSKPKREQICGRNFEEKAA